MVTLALLFSPSTTPLENCFLALKIVEQQRAVSAQRPGDLLHRLDAGSRGLMTPEIQEHAGPGGRVVFPELLKVFLE